MEHQRARLRPRFPRPRPGLTPDCPRPSAGRVGALKYPSGHRTSNGGPRELTALSAFPLPFYASRTISFATPRTLRELEMIQCSAQLRSKPGWFEKMNDTGIVEKW